MEATVVGAGAMGNGIAHVFAQNGHKVNLIDLNEALLEQATATIEKNLDRQVKKERLSEEEKKASLKRLFPSTELEAAAARSGVVVEAVSENIEVKENVFRQLDRFAPEEAILASNTSSISITRLGAATQRPDKVIGMHFMNPVPVMKLVEIIRGYATSDAVSQRIVSLTRGLDKTPVLAHDYPGFVSNRVLMPMINEAIYTLHEGVAGVQEIDTVMMLGMSHPMGPLHLADFIGLDVCHSIMRVLHEGFGNPKYAPCPLLSNMVAAGRLGIKSGQGFYDYSQGVKQKQVAPAFLR